MGNTAPTTVPARLEEYQIDTLFAATPEIRDRILAEESYVVDSDPLYNGHLGERQYRLYGNLSKRKGVNHATMTWYAYRNTIDDFA